ncbi:MAG TPA: M48 family metallopeptidase [Acidimicrobiales bacterium]|nr:M48 family metallopeptidase [Acidimicrobiales bacterium]
MTDNATLVHSGPTYPGISAKAYEHPADRAATSALASIPLLNTVLKKISELGLERSLQHQLLADAVRIGPNQLPDLWAAHLRGLAALDIQKDVALYIGQSPILNASTFGTTKPFVIVTAGAVEGTGSLETATVLAHEHGHVLSEHTHYASVMIILQRLLSTGLSPIGMLPLRALLLVLLEWYRCAELSCDRAAALVTGDPLLVCQTLMRMAGGGVKGLSVDAFIQQSDDYMDRDDLLSRPGRFLIELGRTHPYTVRRVRELTRWVAEGDFDRIRGGSYVHRGEEPPPTAEAKAATEHYRKRFMEVVDRVAGGVQKLADQVTGWLRSDGDREES